jgi:hypothetical protein
MPSKRSSAGTKLLHWKLNSRLKSLSTSRSSSPCNATPSQEPTSHQEALKAITTHEILSPRRACVTSGSPTPNSRQPCRNILSSWRRSSKLKNSRWSSEWQHLGTPLLRNKLNWSAPRRTHVTITLSTPKKFATWSKHSSKKD